jgi:hypothetical protein
MRDDQARGKRFVDVMPRDAVNSGMLQGLRSE